MAKFEADLKAFKTSFLKKQDKFESSIGKIVDDWDARTTEIEESILSDVLGYQRKHKNTKVDFQNQIRNMIEMVEKYRSDIDQSHSKIQVLWTIISYIIENLNLQISSEKQDNADRTKVCLTGMKENTTSDLLTTNILRSKTRVLKQQAEQTGFFSNRSQSRKVAHHATQSVAIENKPSITIDTECLSCSGHTNMIISAFKLACLHYTPSMVNLVCFFKFM